MFAKVVADRQADAGPFDTLGRVYEYMLGIASDARFRPGHIIRLTVELMSSRIIRSNPCGRASGQVLRERHPNILHDTKLREHFHHRMFHGFDFAPWCASDSIHPVHGVTDISYRARWRRTGDQKYTLRLANARRLDYETPTCSRLTLLSPCLSQASASASALICAFDTAGTAANSKLESSCSAACSGPTRFQRDAVRCTKTTSRCAIWFYDRADGWSLADKRIPALPAYTLGLVPRTLIAAASTEQPA